MFYYLKTCPYYLSYYLIRLVYFKELFCKDFALWPRNSFYFKNLVVGRSDLDLTIFFFRSSDPKKLKWILLRYKMIKKICPWLGEINLYQKEEFLELGTVFNRREIERDPLLALYLPRIQRQVPDTIDDKVFVLRMLENDHLLKTCFPKRRKKWAKHLTDLGIAQAFNSDDLELSDLLNLLASAFSLDKALLFAIVVDKKTFYDLYNDHRYCSLLMKYFPHQWMSFAIQYWDFEKDLHRFSDLDEKDSLLVLGQIEWEVMGLLSQYRFASDKKHLIWHLDQMNQIVTKLKTSNLNNTTEKIKKLQSFCMNWKSSNG